MGKTAHLISDNPQLLGHTRDARDRLAFEIYRSWVLLALDDPLFQILLVIKLLVALGWGQQPGRLVGRLALGLSGGGVACLEVVLACGERKGSDGMETKRGGRERAEERRGEKGLTCMSFRKRKNIPARMARVKSMSK